MAAATGTYRKGKVELDTPVNWREGARVTVEPDEEVLGLNEDDWPDTPENRAELLRRMQAFKPVLYSDADRARLAAAQAAVREVTLRAVRKQMGLEA
jgi:hypothetical protein